MMTREERAKQFMAFDAMKGLQEALKDREERHSRVEKHDISEEQIERNCSVLARLRIGDVVRVECYSAFHDVTKRGPVTQLSIPFKVLTVGADRILFDDIYDIEIVG